VTGTLLAASPCVGPDLLAACREVRSDAGRGAVTLLPGLLVARWLGPACEPAKAWLAGIWACLRPALVERAAVTPRIWNT
jgi:urease accessory protein